MYWFRLFLCSYNAHKICHQSTSVKRWTSNAFNKNALIWVQRENQRLFGSWLDRILVLLKLRSIGYIICDFIFALFKSRRAKWCWSGQCLRFTNRSKQLSLKLSRGICSLHKISFQSSQNPPYLRFGCLTCVLHHNNNHEKEQWH